jgi:NAD-dependent SIR2 family protein deacetylase
MFTKDPHLAWGFWMHRYELYSNVKLHEGYNILHEFSKLKNDNYFVFTSNIDGCFERIFPEDKIVECHGQVFHFQWYFIIFITLVLMNFVDERVKTGFGKIKN